MRFLLLLLLSGSAHAVQDGDPDTGFGVGGFRYLDTVPVAGVPTNERGQYAARLSDGRLLIAMHGQQGGMQKAITVVVSADGRDVLASQEFALDFANPIIDPPTRGFGMDAEGGLYIGGTSRVSGTEQAHVLKIEPPDYFTLDPDWGVDGVATLAPFTAQSFLNAMHVDAEGRVVVCGDGRLPDGPFLGFCTRLRSDGSIDPGFGDGFFVINEPGVVRMEIVQSVIGTGEGDYLIAGQATLGGVRHRLLGRLTPSGALNTDFCANCTDAFVAFSAPGYRVDSGAIQFACPRLALRPDGVLASAGILTQGSGNLIYYSRYNPLTGALLGFLTQAPVSGGSPYLGCSDTLAVQPDNKVVLACSQRWDGVQYGALVRFPETPTIQTPRDTDFAESAALIRGVLPDGMSSASNECNYALVEDDGILCVGLASRNTSPANADVMLARVLNGVTDDVFADGFE